MPVSRRPKQIHSGLIEDGEHDVQWLIWRGRIGYERAMRHRWLRGVVIIAAVGAVASVLWLAFGRGKATIVSEPVQISTSRANRGRQPGAVVAPTLRGAAAPSPVPSASVPGAPAAEVTPGEPFSGDLTPEQAQEIAAAWSAVDMEEVRKAMPDNLYWKYSSPTKDPQVLEEREAERSRWNEEYGKVLSGTATEEEIKTYYDRRARLSGDYIEFLTYLLDHYTLPERDVGLMKLAARLHRSRLEEIPRKMEQALERKAKQDEARAAWLADQQIFGDANPAPAPPDEPAAE